MSRRNQNSGSPKLGRRTLLKGAASLAGGALLPSAVVAESKTSVNGCSTIVSAGGGKAVVETTAGKAGGYVRHGGFTFQRVPHSAPVARQAGLIPPAQTKAPAGGPKPYQ